MITWVNEVVIPATEKREAIIKWYAHDEFDNERLSPIAMQDGMTSELAMDLWQRKHWSLLKEKFLATEKMTFAEARNIKSYDELKAWLKNRASAIKAQPIVVPPEERAVVDIPAENQETIDKVKNHLAEPLPPIDMDKVVMPKGKKVASNNSKLANKIGEIVASKI
jgi:hypothetical protein